MSSFVYGFLLRGQQRPLCTRRFPARYSRVRDYSGPVTACTCAQCALSVAPCHLRVPVQHVVPGRSSATQNEYELLSVSLSTWAASAAVSKRPDVSLRRRLLAACDATHLAIHRRSSPQPYCRQAVPYRRNLCSACLSNLCYAQLRWPRCGQQVCTFLCPFPCYPHKTISHRRRENNIPLHRTAHRTVGLDADANINMDDRGFLAAAKIMDAKDLSPRPLSPLYKDELIEQFANVGRDSKDRSGCDEIATDDGDELFTMHMDTTDGLETIKQKMVSRTFTMTAGSFSWEVCSFKPPLGPSCGGWMR